MTLVNRHYPNRIALVTESGTEVTYAELNDAIESFRKYLRKGVVVFIMSENDFPPLLCYLSSLSSGAVPLLLSPGIHEAQLSALIDTYHPQFIFRKTLPLPSDDRWEIVHNEGDYAMYASHSTTCAVLHEYLALLLATSGSTGSPKLVRLSHQNLVANAASIAQYLKIGAADRAITSLPFYYSYGLSVINSHLSVGASLLLTDRSMLDAQFWRLVREHSVTSIAGVPYNYEMLLKLRFANISIPSVRKMTQAGGKLDKEKIELVYNICKTKNIDFYTMYGQTEASPRIAYLSTEETIRKLGSIGVAIPGGRLWLEDTKGELISQAGVTGELVYEGPNVSLGYAESLDDLLLGDCNQGVLHTGDLGRFDEEGYFFIEGRISRFLKIFGIRISLDEVEKIVAAKGYTCAAHGTDDNLVLHVVEAQSLSSESLRIEMAESLGLHKTAISVNPLTEFPRLATGKINYQMLNQMS
jgi:acyl-coenzyme A synthetase/AMP-(fatty) acid ligase